MSKKALKARIRWVEDFGEGEKGYAVEIFNNIDGEWGLSSFFEVRKLQDCPVVPTGFVSLLAELHNLGYEIDLSLRA